MNINELNFLSFLNNTAIQAFIDVGTIKIYSISQVKEMSKLMFSYFVLDLRPWLGAYSQSARSIFSTWVHMTQGWRCGEERTWSSLSE